MDKDPRSHGGKCSAVSRKKKLYKNTRTVSTTTGSRRTPSASRPCAEGEGTIRRKKKRHKRPRPAEAGNARELATRESPRALRRRGTVVMGTRARACPRCPHRYRRGIWIRSTRRVCLLNARICTTPPPLSLAHRRTYRDFATAVKGEKRSAAIAGRLTGCGVQGPRMTCPMLRVAEANAPHTLTSVPAATAAEWLWRYNAQTAACSLHLQYAENTFPACISRTDAYFSPSFSVNYHYAVSAMV